MISSKRPQETALEKKKEFKKVSKEEQKPVKKFQDYNFISLNTSNISPHGNKEGPGVSSTFEDIRKFSSPQQSIVPSTKQQATTSRVHSFEVTN
jgi:hypothetical protein